MTVSKGAGRRDRFNHAQKTDGTWQRTRPYLWERFEPLTNIKSKSITLQRTLNEYCLGSQAGIHDLEIADQQWR